MYSLAASGGDRGIGTINVSEYYDDGERVETTKLDTPQATTSGTIKDFTSPFATTTRDIAIFDEVSTNGTTDFIIQLGDSGGVETSGYISLSTLLDASQGSGGDEVDKINRTNGFVVFIQNNTDTVSGTYDIILSNATNNTYIGSSVVKINNSDTVLGAGSKASLDTVLTTIRFTSIGPDTYDAGEVNVRWYGY